MSVTRKQATLTTVEERKVMISMSSTEGLIAPLDRAPIEERLLEEFTELDYRLWNR
jgi:hypothetical protein